MDKEEQTLDEFREEKRKKKAQMTAMQNLPHFLFSAFRIFIFSNSCINTFLF